MAYDCHRSLLGHTRVSVVPGRQRGNASISAKLQGRARTATLPTLRLTGIAVGLYILHALASQLAPFAFVAGPRAQRTHAVTGVPVSIPQRLRKALAEGSSFPVSSAVEAPEEINVTQAAVEAADAEASSAADVRSGVAETTVAGNVVSWVLFGVSLVYLAHFASLYTQLPGLFGSSGLEPIAGRPEDVEATWILHFFPRPELGMEVLTLAGAVLASLQLIVPDAALRAGQTGSLAYAALWAFWHDLVASGGRFTLYQMDMLLLDAAPLCVLAASGVLHGAATFGLRWLLFRLYLGGGAVKLLSCDESWRNLSALHWHFQSQPLPNPIGVAAHVTMPQAVGEFSTLFALLAEIALPFLFLAPSADLRRLAFALQAALQAGIVIAGNFGPFNALTMVLSLALLEDGDLPHAPGVVCGAPTAKQGPTGRMAAASLSRPVMLPAVAPLADSAAVILTFAGAAWTLHNVQANCQDTWASVPLVGGALLLAPWAYLASCARSIPEAATGFALLAGTAWPLARGLGVLLPAVFADFNVLGASSYGLFARMTGVGGRPTLLIEAAQDVAGPWSPVPFRYQVMDPAGMPALCFPHFPRLDWTHWFTPFGGNDCNLRGWLGALLRGIASGKPEVIDLLDGAEFRRLFPGSPPAYVRLSPETYSAVLPSTAGGAWWIPQPADVGSEAAWQDMPKGSLFARPLLLGQEDLMALGPSSMLEDSGDTASQPWPGAPLRHAADGAGEAFIWMWLAIAEAARRAAQQKPDGGDIDRLEAAGASAQVTEMGERGLVRASEEEAKWF